MILYTMTPCEQIFPAAEEEYSRYEMITFNGIQLLAEMQGSNGYRVDRILSTDPAHYMEQSLQPGAIIRI
jgi:hypothetical protein